MEVTTHVAEATKVQMVAETQSDMKILEQLQDSLSKVTHTDLSPDKLRFYFKLHEGRRVNAE